MSTYVEACGLAPPALPASLAPAAGSTKARPFASTRPARSPWLIGTVYNPASGRLLSGSFMDYCMPRADGLPRMTVSTHSTPSAHTPMGVKGCGEVGTIGSPAAVTNAVVDALSAYGISHIDMPATPDRIRQLIRSGALPQAAE
jgi:hypothetical protein